MEKYSLIRYLPRYRMGPESLTLSCYCKNLSPNTVEMNSQFSSAISRACSEYSSLAYTE